MVSYNTPGEENRNSFDSQKELPKNKPSLAGTNKRVEKKKNI